MMTRFAALALLALTACDKPAPHVAANDMAADEVTEVADDSGRVAGTGADTGTDNVAVDPD